MLYFRSGTIYNAFYVAADVKVQAIFGAGNVMLPGKSISLNSADPKIRSLNSAASKIVFKFCLSKNYVLDLSSANPKIPHI